MDEKGRDLWPCRDSETGTGQADEAHSQGLGAILLSQTGNAQEQG